MPKLLAEALEIIEAPGLDQDSQDAEQALMEAAINALCHGGIVYPDSYGMTNSAFDWIGRNANFVEGYFSVRGDIFVRDEVMGMAYVRSGKPNGRRLGIMKLQKDEVLVGCILRGTYETLLSQGADNRVRSSRDDIHQALRQVAEMSESEIPNDRRIKAILHLFETRGCIRMPSVDEDGEFTIMPGIKVLFDNDTISQMETWSRDNLHTITAEEAANV